MPLPLLTLTEIDSKKSLSSGFYEIHPAFARAILTDRNKHNRKVAEQKVAALTDDILNDRFKPNGETIIFDRKGQLLDAGHRLSACVKANKPIISNVAFFIDPAHQVTIDQGKSRNAADAMMVEYQWNNVNVLAAVARFMLAYEASGGTRFSGGVNVSGQAVIAWVKAHGDVHAVVSWATGYQSKVTGMTTPSALAIARLILEPKYGLEVVSFIDQVATGINLSPGDPALAARSKLQGMAREAAKVRRRVSTPQAVEALMICCVSFVKGEKRTNFVLKATPPHMPVVKRRHHAADSVL